MFAILGTQTVNFSFSSDKTSTRSETESLMPPPGTIGAQAVLQGFDLAYSNNNQYGFGEQAIGFTLTDSNGRITCTVTLRDNNVNERVWEGSVEAIVFFYRI